MPDNFDPMVAYDAKSGVYTLYQVTTFYIGNDGLLCKRQLTGISEDLDAIALYMGRVRGIPLVAEEKDYVTFQPGLPVGVVEVIRFTDMNDMLQYLDTDRRSDFILTPYPFIDRVMARMKKKEAKNLKVPRIVCSIVERDVDGLQDMLRCTFKNLKTICYLTRDDGVTHLSPLDRSPIISMCKWLEKSLTETGFEKLSNCVYNRHAIFFCPEDEYRTLIHQAQEIEKFHEEFIERLHSND